jgi:nitrite reductase/ring-hydroxylating ferredoxin subunit/multimeric flavodoxin WrbA
MGQEHLRTHVAELGASGMGASTLKVQIAGLKFLYEKPLGRPNEVAWMSWPRAPRGLPRIAEVRDNVGSSCAARRYVMAVQEESGTWVDIGSAEELARTEVRQVSVGSVRIALTHKDGVFGAISGSCNHAGGPLGKGTLEGDYVVCPWHQWRFHRVEGHGERGFEEDVVPAYHVRVRDGRVEINDKAHAKRAKKPHEPHPLTRPISRGPGKARVVGISTTAMQKDYPRFSTSECLLETALGHAASKGHETKLIRLRDLSFRTCEGFYSKSARACTWPCSITQMDPNDELDRVYEAFVHWGDVFLVATPIRWGAPSSLYFKMVERMNCIQNQVTIAGKVLLQNKVVGALITGGQDNVQGVAGQMLGFFAELGCQFPQFPYIAHSRGWTAEDMERNVARVQSSAELAEASKELADRCVDLAGRLLSTEPPKAPRAGRKGRALPVVGNE